MTDLFWLSGTQLERIEPYFPLSHGVPRVDDHRVVSGIVFVIKNGLRWRDALMSPEPRCSSDAIEAYRSCGIAQLSFASWARKAECRFLRKPALPFRKPGQGELTLLPVSETAPHLAAVLHARAAPPVRIKFSSLRHFSSLDGA